MLTHWEIITKSYIINIVAICTVSTFHLHKNSEVFLLKVLLLLSLLCHLFALGFCSKFKRGMQVQSKGWCPGHNHCCFGYITVLSNALWFTILEFSLLSECSFAAWQILVSHHQVVFLQRFHLMAKQDQFLWVLSFVALLFHLNLSCVPLCHFQPDTNASLKVKWYASVGAVPLSFVLLGPKGISVMELYYCLPGVQAASSKRVSGRLNGTVMWPHFTMLFLSFHTYTHTLHIKQSKPAEILARR